MKQSPRNGGSSSPFLSYRRLGVLLVAILAFLFFRCKDEVKAAAKAFGVQAFIYSQNFFGAALLFDGLSGDPSPMPLDFGYFNIFQIKAIWLSRYFAKDQFLFSGWESTVHEEIRRRLMAQYEKMGWTEKDLSLEVPTFQWGEIDKETFFENYAKRGVQVVIKNFPSRALKLWSPKYFAENYGNHSIEAINISSISSLRTTLSEFYEQSKKGEPLYIRALSDIFDAHTELLDDVAVHEFDDWMKSNYMTSQIFMGYNKPGTGTSYHCANFNNLFFQVLGRKKWTFVDPHYSPLIYPMFNAKSMDVASFVTTVALANSTMMSRYFPLYELAPKLSITLEPGDVLMNPPWNWHMIENLDSTSIGVASRWFLPMGHSYQNSVHATLQWFSSYMWKTYYTKMLNLQRNVRAHATSNTPPMDDRLNFGKKGSAVNFTPKIFPDSFYKAQEHVQNQASNRQ